MNNINQMEVKDMLIYMNIPGDNSFAMQPERKEIIIHRVEKRRGDG